MLSRSFFTNFTTSEAIEHHLIVRGSVRAFRARKAAAPAAIATLLFSSGARLHERRAGPRTTSRHRPSSRPTSDASADSTCGCREASRRNSGFRLHVAAPAPPPVSACSGSPSAAPRSRSLRARIFAATARSNRPCARRLPHRTSPKRYAQPWASATGVPCTL